MADTDDAGDDTTGGDLREILGMAPRAVVPRLSVGQLIDGVYRIEEVLGEGGMGRVYRARDTRLARDVAIKLERHALVDDSVLQREATALARLAHPNVVTVYEVGTWAGHPWVAMEYVRGSTARVWQRAAKRTAREILAIYLDAARGLAASHAAGLVHRDFKPDNVLVGDDGRVRVADFGLAHDVADDRVARAASGTPGYMAPEQRAHGAVGPAADQYAFAVALWEALSGQRPFARDGEATLAPLPDHVPRHVERALRRALSEAPGDRWPAMTALIAALDRDPARTRRRALLVGAAAVIAIGGTWAVARAVDREPVSCDGGDAELASVWSPAARGRISDPRAVAQIEKWAERWKSGRRAACEATHVDRRQSPQLLDLRIACLDRGRASLEVTLAELANTTEPARAIDMIAGLPAPESCADVASLSSATQPVDPVVDRMIARTRVLRLAGKSKEAVDAGREAAAYADEHGLPNAGARARIELAAAIHATGTIDGVLETYERAALLAAEARDDFVHAMAWLNVVGVIAVRKGKPEETDRLISAAEAAVLRAGSPPFLVSMLAGRRADIAFERQQYAAAVPLFEQAIAGWVKRHGANEPDLARWHNRLGSTLAKLRRYAEARAHLQHARGILESHYGPIHPNVGVVLTTLSQLEYRIGDFAAAEASAKQALEIKIATRGPDHATLAPTLHNLALAQERIGNLADALQHAQRSAAIYERTSPPNHPNIGLALASVGRISGLAGDWTASEAALKRAIEILTPAGDKPPLDDALVAMAALHVHRGDGTRALAAAERALAIAEPRYGASQETLRAISAVARAKHAAGDRAGAKSTYERALAMARETLGDKHPDTIAIAERMAAFDAER